MSVVLLDHFVDAPESNFRLIRLCEWAGESYKTHHHATITPNALTPWKNLTPAATAILAMGPRTLEPLGIGGHIDKVRGYPYSGDGVYIVPTVAPGYIERGNAKWSAAFINDLQKAVHLGRDGMPPQFTSYLLDPSPLGAYQWAQRYIQALDQDPSIRLAFDIETPGKGEDEDDTDTDSDAPDRTWRIERIGFSYKPLGALSIPWAPEYMAATKLLMGSRGEKVVWNAGFDCPRIRRSGVAINGLVHDGMVAWHILHSDLKKGLGFVATFTCPWQPAWKHLSGARPAFYNATDADVELRSMIAIEAELRKTGLWEVYERDVVQLEPILVHMQQSGMPIDAGVRADRAAKLALKLGVVKQQLESLVPLEARKIAHVYKDRPKDTTGLLSRPGMREVRRCSLCGCEKPGKPHFKRFVKKVNPCAEAQVVLHAEPVAEYYRLADFSPSRDQLVRYHQHVNRPLPTVWDNKAKARKVSFGEEQIKTLMLRYPLDLLYPVVLEYRALDKLAGTYVGRPIEV